MKERPIIFSGPMVQAILSGTKTQTRRIVKNAPTGLRDLQSEHAKNIRVTDGGIQCDWFAGVYSIPIRCPYGKPGDRLWVRESFYCDHMLAGDYNATSKQYLNQPVMAGPACEREWQKMLYYRSDIPSGRFEDADYWAEPGSHWKPSIHMPRWASRITLEITDVRVQRLQEISEEDALAEGIQIPVNDKGAPLLCISQTVPTHKLWRDHRNATAADWMTGYFALTWNEINGKRQPWDSNPWVWVISFKRVS